MELGLSRQESFMDYVKRRLADCGIRKPLTVCIDLTSSCNLSCSYCYLRKESSAASLPLGLVGRLIPELLQLGTLEVVVSGGEPTLHPDFTRIVNMIKDAGLRLCILTNGSQPDPLLSVRSVLQKDDYIQVSVDALVDYASRQGAEAALSTVRLLAARGVPLTVNAVANRENRELIPPLVEELHSSGVRSFSLNFLYPFSESDFRLCLSPDEQFFLDRQVSEWCGALGLKYSTGLNDAVTAINSSHMRDAVARST